MYVVGTSQSPASRERERASHLVNPLQRSRRQLDYSSFLRLYSFFVFSQVDFNMWAGRPATQFPKPGKLQSQVIVAERERDNSTLVDDSCLLRATCDVKTQKKKLVNS